MQCLAAFFRMLFIKVAASKNTLESAKKKQWLCLALRLDKSQTRCHVLTIVVQDERNRDGESRCLFQQGFIGREGRACCYHECDPWIEPGGITCFTTFASPFVHIL